MQGTVSANISDQMTPGTTKSSMPNPTTRVTRMEAPTSCQIIGSTNRQGTAHGNRFAQVGAAHAEKQGRLAKLLTHPRNQYSDDVDDDADDGKGAVGGTRARHDDRHARRTQQCNRDVNDSHDGEDPGEVVLSRCGMCSQGSRPPTWVPICTADFRPRSRFAFLPIALDCCQAQVTAYPKRLYFTIHRMAENPSRHPIFFPSLYVRP